ncbi:GNAT family N-acetyltransferase [Rufibacter glacialis]|uniref:GNAT family N-acetyltransferase n=1 Tax=Rufibacter glacialis TaxID=1259555 RepID=A0A5M8QHM1_9BACT|nr:GNAT family N-acetyltransferase [Rufibacter glacialis]KAA6434430.1 GNAT family N-acetyltransferase [Rufibacter glacialis]GGK69529.1 N-acetyltransferase [Rufibacter glacialis]
MEIEIKEIEQGRIPELVTYVREFRKGLFPMIDHSVIPEDLANFEACYVQDEKAVFLVASEADGTIIGTIGMRRYDHRFPHLDYSGQVANEVLKLFVEPAYRKMGLGRSLVNALKEEATRRGVETLYLHTHPFLSGAKEFWTKQGFQMVCQDDTEVFRTIHMDLALLQTVNARAYGHGVT